MNDVLITVAALWSIPVVVYGSAFAWHCARYHALLTTEERDREAAEFRSYSEDL